ncbi:MAG: hypothetical protein FJY82_04375 [Candidatus Aminicenantes bacterium]|nr:hypothetical protein [Candidatus Aminicenantes bacterium]
MNLKGFKKLGASAVLFLAVAAVGSAQLNTTEQTLNTTVYFDYAHYLNNDGYLTSAKAKSSAFAFRRAYLTYERKLSDYLRFRFRYDADNAANITSINFANGTTSSDAKLRPYVKHICLQWNQDWLQSQVNIGMIETMSFKLTEDRWGYRSVAKTFADGYSDLTGQSIDQTSADLGVSWKGTLAKELRFGLGVFSGNGYTRPENDQYKKFAGYLQLVPLSGVSLFTYADIETQVEGKKAVTYKIDAFINLIKNANLVFEWLQYDNETRTFKSGGWSAYATYMVNPGKLGAFLRYDRYQPDSNDSLKNVDLIIAGLDWFAWGSFCRIQPNVWIRSYKDSLKKTDVIGVATFFMSF